MKRRGYALMHAGRGSVGGGDNFKKLFLMCRWVLGSNALQIRNFEKVQTVRYCTVQQSSQEPHKFVRAFPPFFPSFYFSLLWLGDSAVRQG